MASLYDDYDIDQANQQTSKKSSDAVGTTITPSPSETSKINLSFLKTQLEAKKALLQKSAQQKITSPSAIRQTTIIQAPTIQPTQLKPKSLLNLKSRRALPVSVDSTFTIVPKALKEDKVFLFGEVLIEDEYNPTAPTDYVTYRQKRDVQRAKEKAAREVAERLQRQLETEDQKRSIGAAIAPPKELMEEEDNAVAPTTSQPINFEPPAQFGKAGSRGLGVAANIMQKMGYQEGTGLGRFGQGISQALKVERTGKNLGLIVNQEQPQEVERKRFKQDPDSIVADETSQQDMTEVLKSATKILLLRNMVYPSDVDSELESEIREEMKKFGQLTNVVIYQIPNKPDEEAVRIFLEFHTQAQAIKAFVGTSGRIFGGRLLRASFYPLDDFSQRKLDNEIPS